MRVSKQNDEVIRSVSTFKKYNDELTEVVEEYPAEISGHGLERPLYCGIFIAKVYVGQRIIGTYKFDCRHFRNFRNLDRLMPKLTKIK